MYYEAKPEDIARWRASYVRELFAPSGDKEYVRILALLLRHYDPDQDDAGAGEDGPRSA